MTKPNHFYKWFGFLFSRNLLHLVTLSVACRVLLFSFYHLIFHRHSRGLRRFPSAGKVTKRAAAAFYCYQVSTKALPVPAAIKKGRKKQNGEFIWYLLLNAQAKMKESAKITKAVPTSFSRPHKV
ncbi:MAG TPA: hypothetical protein VEV16_08915 [Daejeonella sp.]|nr:hypothetical protein [Daejeonella sp.]